MEFAEKVRQAQAGLRSVSLNPDTGGTLINLCQGWYWKTWALNPKKSHDKRFHGKWYNGIRGMLIAFFREYKNWDTRPYRIGTVEPKRIILA